MEIRPSKPALHQIIFNGEPLAVVLGPAQDFSRQVSRCAALYLFVSDGSRTDRVNFSAFLSNIVGNDLRSSSNPSKLVSSHIVACAACFLSNLRRSCTQNALPAKACCPRSSKQLVVDGSPKRMSRLFAPLNKTQTPSLARSRSAAAGLTEICPVQSLYRRRRRQESFAQDSLLSRLAILGSCCRVGEVPLLTTAMRRPLDATSRHRHFIRLRSITAACESFTTVPSHQEHHHFDVVGFPKRYAGALP